MEISVREDFEDEGPQDEKEEKLDPSMSCMEELEHTLPYLLLFMLQDLTDSSPSSEFSGIISQKSTASVNRVVLET